VTCISTRIEDGGHFVPFAQNICRRKQDMKKTGKKSIIYSLKSSFKRENKNIAILPFPFISTVTIQAFSPTI
jgi:hypothetical protein